MSMASRPVHYNHSKQAVYQKPVIDNKQKLKQSRTVTQNSSKTSISASGGMNGKKKLALRKSGNHESEKKKGDLHVKLPSVESDDYRSSSAASTSVTSSSPSETEEEDEEEEDIAEKDEDAPSSKDNSEAEVKNEQAYQSKCKSFKFNEL